MGERQRLGRSRSLPLLLLLLVSLSDSLPLDLPSESLEDSLLLLLFDPLSLELLPLPLPLELGLCFLVASGCLALLSEEAFSLSRVLNQMERRISKGNRERFLTNYSKQSVHVAASTFSQHTSEVVRIDSIIIFHLNEL